MRHASSGEQPRVLAIRVPGDHCRVPAADADRDDPQGGPVSTDLPCQPDRGPDGYRLARGDDPGVRAEKGWVRLVWRDWLTCRVDGWAALDACWLLLLRAGAERTF